MTASSGTEVFCVRFCSILTYNSYRFMEKMIFKGLSMRGSFHRRLVTLLGPMGATLVAIGFFLPFRTEIFTGTGVGLFAPPYHAATVLTDSFWQMLVNTIQGGDAALFFPWPLESLIIRVFLPSTLSPQPTFLRPFLR